MQVVIVNGSYHRDGMTSVLVKSFAEGVRSRSPDAKIKEIFLMSKDFAYCTGCNHCQKDKDPEMGKCIHKDFVQKACRELVDADIAVLASPVYEYAVTAVMKKFLERNFPLVRGGFPIKARKPHKKAGVAFISTGCPWPINRLLGITRYPEFIMKLMLRQYGKKKVHVVCPGAMETSPKEQEKWKKKAWELGRRLG